MHLFRLLKKINRNIKNENSLDFPQGMTTFFKTNIFMWNVPMSKFIEILIEKWPGKRLGNYRFLPIFFALGAGLEFTMINW